MRILILRLEAPMMSFGDVAIDERRGTARHPYKSMIVGLLANALGLRRSQPQEIESLHAAVTIASRLDRPGSLMTDYHTAIAGDGSENGDKRSFLSRKAWSTRGYPMGRSNTDLVYQSWRDYRCDASVCVAISSTTGIDEIESAIREPRRPLYLGRKCCLPSRPPFEEVVEEDDIASALIALPFVGSVSAQWPAELGTKGRRVMSHIVPDDRDWANGVPIGHRNVFETVLQEGLEAR